MDEPDLVPIGTFAQASRLTVKALRHYQAVGVLVPARVDPATGHRSYRWEQLGDALSITTLRQLDVPLSRIARHVVGGTPLHDVLAEERDRLEATALRTQRALAVVDALEGMDAFPDAAADRVTWTDHRAVVMRTKADADHIGPVAAALVAQLLGRAAAVGLDVTPPVVGTYPMTLAGTVPVVVHLPLGPDDGSPGTRPRSDPDGLTVAPVAGGSLVRVVHVGPHESLPIAYHALLRELARRRVVPQGPVHERYLDDPEVVAPDVLRTEVLHRVP